MAFLFRRAEAAIQNNYDYFDVPTRITIESPAKVIAATYAHKLDNALVVPENIVYERTLFTSPSSLELLPPRKNDVDRLPTIEQSDDWEDASEEAEYEGDLQEEDDYNPFDDLPETNLMTPEHHFVLAVFNDDMDTIKSLISTIRVNAPLCNGYTPLVYACYYGHLEIVQFLLDHGAHPYFVQNQPALIFAAQAGHLEIISLLLEHKCNVNSVYPVDRRNALHEMCLRGNLLMVQALLEFGVNPYHLDIDGRNLYHYAVLSNNIELIHYIADTIPHLNLNEQTIINHKTPLVFAIQAQLYDMVEYLLIVGADKTICDYHGNDAINVCRLLKDRRMLRIVERSTNLQSLSGGGTIRSRTIKQYIARQLIPRSLVELFSTGTTAEDGDRDSDTCKVEDTQTSKEAPTASSSSLPSNQQTKKTPVLGGTSAGSFHHDGNDSHSLPHASEFLDQYSKKYYHGPLDFDQYLCVLLRNCSYRVFTSRKKNYISQYYNALLLNVHEINNITTHTGQISVYNHTRKHGHPAPSSAKKVEENPTATSDQPQQCLPVSGASPLPENNNQQTTAKQDVGAMDRTSASSITTTTSPAMPPRPRRPSQLVTTSQPLAEGDNNGGPTVIEQGMNGASNGTTTTSPALKPSKQQDRVDKYEHHVHINTYHRRVSVNRGGHGTAGSSLPHAPNPVALLFLAELQNNPAHSLPIARTSAAPAESSDLGSSTGSTAPTETRRKVFSPSQQQQLSSSSSSPQGSMSPQAAAPVLPPKRGSIFHSKRYATLKQLQFPGQASTGSDNDDGDANQSFSESNAESGEGSPTHPDGNPSNHTDEREPPHTPCSKSNGNNNNLVAVSPTIASVAESPSLVVVNHIPTERPTLVPASPSSRAERKASLPSIHATSSAPPPPHTPAPKRPVPIPSPSPAVASPSPVPPKRPPRPASSSSPQQHTSASSSFSAGRRSAQSNDNPEAAMSSAITPLEAAK